MFMYKPGFFIVALTLFYQLYVISNLPFMQITLITNQKKNYTIVSVAVPYQIRDFTLKFCFKSIQNSYCASNWRHYVDLKGEASRILDEKQLHATINEGLVHTFAAISECCESRY
ncbi:hypothetical protein CEXT_224381 [Caerostris extrusa]|uniref:Uncharacterized protein n=1 Tax=Caerostris extrusa TaxID=172846 RepID=A0AAV4VBF3_CAEEX|nr:hypothetical protein CEXT_224381 [Caerostris extrusa]